ncbi:MAG TPA: hypothetical protein VGF45_00025 [Polyangia bacterium]
MSDKRAADEADDEVLLRKLGTTLRNQRAQENLGPTSAPALAADAVDLEAPLSERLRERLVDGALASLGAAPASIPAPARVAAPEEPTGVDVRRRRPPRRASTRAMGAFVMLAAAAWLLWPKPRLPSYTFEIEGGDSSARGPITAPASASSDEPGRVPPIIVTPQSTLTLVLRPTAPTTASLEARLYVASDPGASDLGAPPVAVELAPERAPGGSMRWRGTARDFVGSRTGDVLLLVVVSQPDAQPAPASLAPGRPHSGRGWQSFPTRVRVTSAPP